MITLLNERKKPIIVPISDVSQKGCPKRKFQDLDGFLRVSPSSVTLNLLTRAIMGGPKIDTYILIYIYKCRGHFEMMKCKGLWDSDL